MLRDGRALSSEWRLNIEKWPSIVHCAQKIINQSPQKRPGLLGKWKWKCPLEALTRTKPTGLIIKPFESKYSTNVESISRERIAKIIRVNVLLNTLDEMHKKVSNDHTRMTNKPLSFYNFKAIIMFYCFHGGNSLIVHLACAQKSMLSTEWTGLMRITGDKSDFEFEVENLCKLEKTVVHVQR